MSASMTSPAVLSARVAASPNARRPPTRRAPAPLAPRRGLTPVVAAIEGPGAGAGVATRAAPGEVKDIAQDWQLDFCSRPMKDERGKKMWELLICDETRSFEHSEFFPNNRINSVELAKAIDRVFVARGERPRRFKFFRSQMQTIITRACGEVEIGRASCRERV